MIVTEMFDELISIGEALRLVGAAGHQSRLVSTWLPSPLRVRITTSTNEPPQIGVRWVNSTPIQTTLGQTLEARPDEWDTTGTIHLSQIGLELEVGAGQLWESVSICHPVAAALGTMGTVPEPCRLEAMVRSADLRTALAKVETRLHPKGKL